MKTIFGKCLNDTCLMTISSCDDASRCTGLKGLFSEPHELISGHIKLV